MFIGLKTESPTDIVFPNKMRLKFPSFMPKDFLMMAQLFKHRCFCGPNINAIRNKKNMGAEFSLEYQLSQTFKILSAVLGNIPLTVIQSLTLTNDARSNSKIPVRFLERPSKASRNATTRVP
jgi:hypothetical protein